MFHFSNPLSDGNCLQSQREKPLCSKCRMDRCLEIGMDPNLIMTEAEKRERFKYFFKKKDEEERLKREQLTRETAAALATLQANLRPILPK